MEYEMTFKVNGENRKRNVNADNVEEAKKIIRKSLNRGDEVQFISILPVDSQLDYLKNIFNLK